MKIKFVLDKDLHRYFALMFVVFVLSQELLVDKCGELIEFRSWCAVVLVLATSFLFRDRNAKESCCINMGFLLSMMFYGRNDLISLFSNPYTENIYSTHCILSSFCGVALIYSLINFGRTNSTVLKTDNKKNRDFLFPERKETFKAFSEYISSHSVVGVDSPYGNGKTTFVDILKNEKESAGWCFVTIGILSTTVDNVEYCIIREIERVLGYQGLFSGPLNKIKSFFSHDFAFCIGDLLFESRSYEDKIKDFVEDIHRLKKTIVLNFEDIDRIIEIDHLNKIFSICDTLLTVESKSGFNEGFIKVIYQCNMESLNKLFDEKYGEKRYIEKYIKQAYSIPRLADAFFKNVLNRNLQKYDKIANKDFGFLNRRFVYSTTQGELSLSLSLDNPTVRGVEQILDKINYACGLYAEDSNNNFEAIVIFNIVMYFFPHIYNCLSKKKNLDEQKLFHYENPETGDEKMLSLSELRDYKSSTGTIEGVPVEKIFFDDIQEANKNREILILLCLLGYEGWFYGYGGLKDNNIVLKMLDLH